MNRFIVTLFFCVALSMSVPAQNAFLRELLDLPAPPPVKFPESNAESNPPRPPDFFSKSKVPPDDAPIEELLEYWAVQNRVGELDYQPEISDVSLNRILEFCREKPENLLNYLSLIEKKPKFTDSVKQIYDAEAGSEKVQPYWRERMKDWLKYNTNLYTDKLMADVRDVKDQAGRDTENEKELFALAKVEWDLAAPILERLAADKTQPFSSVSARWAMYQHALDTDNASDAEKYRAELKAIVADRNAEPGVRDKAMDALVITPHWEGRDEWYVSLLEDESLLAMQENGFTGLTTLIRHSSPGKWADAMIKLVGSQNAAVRSSAVRNLFSMLDESRPEIIAALLPWLSNPAWAKESDDGERSELIGYVGKNDVPEAVPGLIWIITNDEENLQEAAQALVRYKSAQAIPALRNALQNATNTKLRAVLIETLVASGGFTVEEQTSALEFYAAFISTAEGKQRLEEDEQEEDYDDEDDEESNVKIQPLPVAVSIGKLVEALEEPDDALIWHVIERRKVLLKSKPVVAQMLTDVLKNWEGRAADLFRLNEVKNNVADVEMTVKVLTVRKNLRETMAAEIAQMRGAAGAASGLAACITEDEADLKNAFHSENADTRVAVLACARLLRAPLPIAEVGTLLKNPNKMLALAAERYLETDDGIEARTLIWAAHPNEAIILGARTSFNPAKKKFSNNVVSELFRTVNNYPINYIDFAEFDKYEAKLQKEVLETPELRMIYAYGRFSVRVYQDRAVIAYHEDETRYRERNLTKEEFENFQRLIQEKNLGSVSPLFECGANSADRCSQSEFLMINRSGGRRVWGYADFTKGIGGLNTLLLNFQNIQGKPRYELEKFVPGLEVVAADSRYSLKTVWKNGDDLRILVLDKTREVEKQVELQRLSQSENANPDLKYIERAALQMKRHREREFENYSWRTIGKDGIVGDAADEPAAVPFLKNILEVPFTPNFDRDEFGWKLQTGNFQIRTGGDGENVGLYKTNRASTTRILEGKYDSPVVSPDGKWAIVSKDEASDNTNAKSLMRVNLATNREYKINLPPTAVLNTLAYVPAHNKFLVFRGHFEWDRKEGKAVAKVAEYYLVDAATGAIQLVKGEFQPLIQQTFRPLQPTGELNEYWAAISDEKKTTAIGIYNAKTFTFTPLLKLPEIRLTSMDIWADEAAGKIYFVYAGNGERDGHLLSLPLPAKP